MTATKDTAALESRLDRIEHQMERLLGLLEGRVDAVAKGREIKKLAAGLTDPKFVEALGRLSRLVPTVADVVDPSHRADAVARARARIAASSPSQDADARVQAGLAMADRLADSGAADAAALIGDRLEPWVVGTRAALESRTEAEGRAAVAERAADLIVRLTDPETSESLLRLAELAPQLEYAANFAAAGPALLEEAMGIVRAESSAMDPRLTQEALDLVRALAAPDVLRSLNLLAGSLADLSPTLRGVARGLRAHAQVEGAHALEARVADAVQELLREDTLDSLIRIANLAPHIEYAVEFLAAGPALLEEGMEVARKTTEGADGGAPFDLRLAKAKDVMLALSEPARLGALERLVGRLDEIERVSAMLSSIDAEGLERMMGALADPHVADGARRLIELAPALAAPLEALPIQPRTLDVLRTINAAVEAASGEKASLGPFGLLGALSKKEVRRAAGFGVGVASRLGRHLEEDELPRLTTGPTNGAGHGTASGTTETS